MQDMSRISHSWNLRPREAIALQKRLARKVIDNAPVDKVSTIAGIDVAFQKDTAIAAVVLLGYPNLERIGSFIAKRKVVFPYIPGLLSFREGPVILEAIGNLDVRPDLCIFDGQGKAHPRRLGIACHIGLITGIPSIGCGKSRLCGHHEEPPYEKGSHVPLRDRDEVIGSVVRTRDGVKPVYVSVGHRIDLESSIRMILSCCTKYRLPEPIRQAHHHAEKAKQR